MTAKFASSALRSRAQLLAGLIIVVVFAIGAGAPGLLSDYAQQISFRLMLYIVLAESSESACGLLRLGVARQRLFHRRRRLCLCRDD